MFLIIFSGFGFKSFNRSCLALKVLLRVVNESVLSIKFVKMNIQYIMKEILNKGTLFYNIVDNSQFLHNEDKRLLVATNEGARRLIRPFFEKSRVNYFITQELECFKSLGYPWQYWKTFSFSHTKNAWSNAGKLPLVLIIQLLNHHLIPASHNFFERRGDHK